MEIKKCVGKLKLLVNKINFKLFKIKKEKPKIADIRTSTRIRSVYHTTSAYTYNNCQFDTYEEMLEYKNLKKYIDSLVEKQQEEERNQRDVTSNKEKRNQEAIISSKDNEIEKKKKIRRINRRF